MRDRLGGQDAADDDDQQRRSGRQRGDERAGTLTRRERPARRARRRARARSAWPPGRALKATISSIPSAIWPWATAPSSTTSADGQGISPAAAPIASSPRHEMLASGWCRGGAVVVVVMVVAARGAGASAARRRRPRPRAGRRRGSATGRGLGQHVLARGASVTAPSANTPAVCVTVTIAPSATRVPRRPARADQVGGDHRLAVPGRERVHARPSRTRRAAAARARPRRPPRRRTTP